MKNAFSFLFGILIRASIVAILPLEPAFSKDKIVKEIAESLDFARPELTRSFNKIDVEEELLKRGIRIDKPIPKSVKRKSYETIVNFEFDSDVPTLEGKAVLNNVGEALVEEKFEQDLFQIAGHADKKGSEEYNTALSQRRAQAVVDYLVKNFDVERSRLRPVGYGEKQPKDPDHPEDAINRRVEIVNLDSILSLEGK